MDAKAGQSLEQVANGTLPHTGRAVKHVAAVAQANKGRQESHGCATGLAVKSGRSCWDLASRSFDAEKLMVPVRSDRYPKRLQAGHHDAGVVTVERSTEPACSRSKGSTDQGSIGDAFRAGRPNPATDGPADRFDGELAGQRW